MVGVSISFVDARRGVSWVGSVDDPRPIARNYRTSLDGRTVTKLVNPAEAYDSSAWILGTDDAFTYAQFSGQIIRWPEP